MHGRAFQHRGWVGEYRAHTTATENLSRELERLHPNYTGLNITHPLKTAVIEYCPQISPLAQRLGAANTLVAVGPSWRAENTDGPGLLRVLGGPGALGGKDALVLGAGGAARATIWALDQAGCARIQIRCRRKTAFEELHARQLTETAALQHLGWHEGAGSVDLVINSTPLGRDTPLDLQAQTPRVLDLNYRPDGPTMLCQKSETMGLITQDGRALLLEQGLLAQQLWFGDLPTGLRQAMAKSLMK